MTNDPTEIDYAKLADALHSAIQRKPRLTSIELTEIMVQEGFFSRVPSRGSVPWRNFLDRRCEHRERANRFMVKKYNCSLEVVGRAEKNERIYGIVMVTKGTLEGPFKLIERFHRGMKRNWRDTERLLLELHELAPAMDSEQLRRHLIYIQRKHDNRTGEYIEDLLHSLDLHGLEEYRPSLSAEIIRLRDREGRTKRRA